MNENMFHSNNINNKMNSKDKNHGSKTTEQILYPTNPVPLLSGSCQHVKATLVDSEACECLGVIFAWNRQAVLYWLMMQSIVELCQFSIVPVKTFDHAGPHTFGVLSLIIDHVHWTCMYFDIRGVMINVTSGNIWQSPKFTFFYF